MNEWFLALFFRGCNLPFYLRFVKCKSVHIYIWRKVTTLLLLSQKLVGIILIFTPIENLAYIYSVDFSYARTEKDTFRY